MYVTVVTFNQESQSERERGGGGGGEGDGFSGAPFMFSNSEGF